MPDLLKTDLSKYSTLKIGGTAKHFYTAKTEEDLISLVKKANELGLKIIPLGEGSNTVFDNKELPYFFIKMEIKGIEILNDKKILKIGAGENWDNVVRFAVGNNLAGIESMSAIPGSAGATPIQNVGAYGQDISQTLIKVRAYDLENKTWTNISNEECRFGYRESAFKNDFKNKYIITQIYLKLEKSDLPLKNIREDIIKTRSKKLPDYREIPNCGSFFKNPIIEKPLAEKIKSSYPEMPIYSTPDNKIVKISAGWLIEKSDLKGKSFGKVSTYKENALILINKNKASFMDLINAKDLIIKTVKEKFKIELEPEPNFIK